jgi:hypothetical protein
MKDGKVGMPTPTLSMPVSGNADSTTKSAIAPGTITITGKQTQGLNNLSRDPSGALNTLGKIFDSGEIATSVAQYQRLKESLAQEEIQSVVRTTEHGAVRLIERGFTPEEISDIKLSPDKIMSQADGASVFIKSISDGKYSVIVEGENGVVTALRNISEKSLNRLANNYGWE